MASSKASPSSSRCQVRPSDHCGGLLGLKVDDPGVTAFTAIIQVGAILAVIIYFWLRGHVNGQAREAPDHRFAWYVILGSIPIGIVGFLAQGPISRPLRNLWVVVVVARVGWSAVMWIAERVASGIARSPRST